MSDQTFILASIVLCSLGGWYVVLTKYFALRQMIKDPHDDMSSHIPGMGPPPVSQVPFLMPEDLLPPMQHMQGHPLETSQPQAPQLPPPNPALDKRNVCNSATILHLLGFGIVFGIPFVNVLLPAIYWLMNKEKHPFIAKQGREVINFQITFSLIQFLCLGLGVLFIRYAPTSAAKLFAFTKIAKIVFTSGMHLPYNVFTVLPFFWACIVMIRGAVSAYHGITYKYPATQQFIFAEPVKKAAKPQSAAEPAQANYSGVNFS